MQRLQNTGLFFLTPLYRELPVEYGNWTVKVLIAIHLRTTPFLRDDLRQKDMPGPIHLPEAPSEPNDREAPRDSRGPTVEERVRGCDNSSCRTS